MKHLSEKESLSLRFNGLNWTLSYLGESCVLFQTKAPIQQINRSARKLKNMLNTHIHDIVPAYESVALFTDLTLREIADKLQEQDESPISDINAPKGITIPICYEYGQDLTEVTAQVGLSKEEVIERHIAGNYEVAFIGFTPGFIYLEGLDKTLTCPRRSNPRKKVLVGSVGIGGSQTGIYSMESPGGWNIVGRTPLKMFNASRQSPMLVEVGAKITLQRISTKQFDSWAS